MKIFHIVNSCTYTSIPVEMAKHMSMKHDVAVVALYDTQIEAEAMVKEIAPSCTVYGCGYKKNKLAGIQTLKKILKNSDLDIVHTHHALSGNLCRTFVYQKGKTKVVHTVHANHHSFNQRQNIVIGCNLNKVDALVSNSMSTKDGLLNWQKRITQKCKHIVIYNGIDTQSIINASDQFAADFYKQNNLDESSYIFLQVGRLEPVKNPLKSLEAFDQFSYKLRNEIKANIYFIYVGDGSEKRKLEEYVSESGYLQKHVIFTGMLKRDNVYSLMNRAQALVVPSLYEGFCNAMVEGMAAGMQLIVSDLPVFRELIPQFYDAYRFSPQSTEDMARQLQTGFEKQTNKIRRWEKQEKVAKEFDIAVCIKKYLALYEELLRC